ncbi:MAG: hypothetical protein IH963_01805 [Chloroflexi bacterium]|nr:hypothetical protein [Chloroflexota bacterium]
MRRRVEADSLSHGHVCTQSDPFSHGHVCTQSGPLPDCHTGGSGRKDAEMSC